MLYCFKLVNCILHCMKNNTILYLLPIIARLIKIWNNMTDLIDIDGQRCRGRVAGLYNVRRASLHPARRPTDIRSWRKRTSQRALKVELAVRYSGESYVDQRSSRFAIENGVVEFVEAGGGRSHESCCRDVRSGRCPTTEFSAANGPNNIVESSVGLTCHRYRLVTVSGYVS